MKADKLRLIIAELDDIRQKTRQQPLNYQEGDHAFTLLTQAISAFKGDLQNWTLQPKTT